jgi:hypothetical protein
MVRKRPTPALNDPTMPKQRIAVSPCGDTSIPSVCSEAVASSRDALERTRGGNRALADRIEHKLGKIGTGVFGENPHRAACEILRDHRRGVAAAAGEPIQFATVGAEPDGAGRHRVLRADSAEEGPFAVGAALQILDIAVFSVTHGEAHTALLIGEMEGEIVVLLNQCALAARVACARPGALMGCVPESQVRK